MVSNDFVKSIAILIRFDQNRLLNMIRQQQATIQALHNQSATGSSAINASAVDDSTPTSERSMSLNHGTTAAPPAQQNAMSSISAPRPRSPFIPHSTLSRNSSYRSGRSSHDASPALHPTSSHGHIPNDGTDIFLGSAAVRDESAFYQAETQTLTRENQMLKLRIRELGTSFLSIRWQTAGAHILTG